MKLAQRGGEEIFFVTAPGSYFNSLAQIFFVSSALSLSHASKILQQSTYFRHGKEGGKNPCGFIFVKSHACPKLVLVRAYLWEGAAKRQLFPILMILSCQFRTCELCS